MEPKQRRIFIRREGGELVRRWTCISEGTEYVSDFTAMADLRRTGRTTTLQGWGADDGVADVFETAGGIEIIVPRT